MRLSERFARILTAPDKQDAAAVVVAPKGYGKSYTCLYIAWATAVKMAEILGGRWEDYFPIDRENNSFFPVEESLRAQGSRAVFTPSQVAALRAAVELKPGGPRLRTTAETDASGGRILNVPVRLPANGVLFMVLKKG